MNSKGVLSREDILARLRANPPLLADLQDIEQQVQPNGVDLTVKEIATLSSSGKISVQNHNRIISGTTPIAFDDKGSINLPAGCYLVTCNEIVNLPKDIMALARPRSSLLRCGVSIHTAVWDAGYSGRSQSLMVVYNQHGFNLHKNARIIQMVFFHLSHEVAEGYNGLFQGENI